MAITRLDLSNPEQSEKPASLISVLLSVALVVTVGAALLFAWIAEEMLEGETARFDNNVRSFVHSFSGPTVTKVMFGLSFMGLWGLVAILVAAVVLFLVKKWHRAIGWMALTMIGAGILEVSLKLGFHRARPTAFFGSLPSSYSFPSGHALFSFCFYMVLAGLINARAQSRWLSTLVWTFSTLLVAGIGLSRIYLGVHWPSDVIAGYLTGAMWVGAMLTIDRVRKTRRGIKVSTAPDGK